MIYNRWLMDEQDKRAIRRYRIPAKILQAFIGFPLRRRLESRLYSDNLKSDSVRVQDKSQVKSEVKCDSIYGPRA